MTIQTFGARTAKFGSSSNFGLVEFSGPFAGISQAFRRTGRAQIGPGIGSAGQPTPAGSPPPNNPNCQRRACVSRALRGGFAGLSRGFRWPFASAPKPGLGPVRPDSPRQSACHQASKPARSVLEFRGPFAGLLWTHPGEPGAGPAGPVGPTGQVGPAISCCSKLLRASRWASTGPARETTLILIQVYCFLPA